LTATINRGDSSSKTEEEEGHRGGRNIDKNVDLTEYQSLFFFKFLFFYYSYVHTMFGSFLPPAPTPSLTTQNIKV
jgi:hypothetical protein